MAEGSEAVRIRGGLDRFSAGSFAAIFVGAGGFAAQAADDFSSRSAKEVEVVGGVAGGELFHAVHGRFEAFDCFDPERAFDGIVFENVVGDEFCHDVTLIGCRLGGLQT